MLSQEFIDPFAMRFSRISTMFFFSSWEKKKTYITGERIKADNYKNLFFFSRAKTCS
jgi:hypothetical protein